VGYHVYRADVAAGPFSRRTSSLVTATSFDDANVPPGNYAYMVRAVSLQANPSGTYFNPSQGIFAKISVIPIPTVQVQVVTNGIVLSWNSLPGASYRVQTSGNPGRTNWIDLSGPVIATDSLTSWVDTQTRSAPQRFYRVSSP